MTSVSVVIPVRNGAKDLLKCLGRLAESRVAPYECIVVDDASTDDGREIAESFGARVVSLPEQSGPAVARNAGAEIARGDVVLFIDADVCVLPDVIEKVMRSFDGDAELTAVFGSYADTCPNPDFFSQYKNLQHAFVHRSARRMASTFWSGCGAVRRERLLAYGGFDTTYGRPCIEDIEFGTRLARVGEKIIVDGSIQVEHRKRYGFQSIIKSDLFDRAIPWTQLILREGQMPDTLNVSIGQRVAAVLVYCFLGLVAASAVAGGPGALTPWFTAILLAMGACLAGSKGRRANLPWSLAALLLGAATATRVTASNFNVYTFGAAVALAGVVFVNRRFYRFLAQRGGWPLAVASIPFHLLYYVYGVLGLLIGTVLYVIHRPAPRPLPAAKLPKRAAMTQAGALR